MLLKKHLPLLAFVAMTAFSVIAQSAVQAPVAASRPVVAATAPAPYVKSYREWKHEMVQDAQTKCYSLKSQLDARKAARSVDPNLAKTRGLEATASRDLSIEKLEKELREDQYDLEVARDLSVTDYFVGYITKIQDKKAAFHQVAGKLSPEEVAELMNAYANSVFGAHAADIPASATNVGKDPTK